MAKSTVPRMPRKTKAGLAREACDILGIKRTDYAGVPKIEGLLREAGVFARVWDYLAASDDEIALALIAKRRCLTQSQVNSLPFEAFCVAAKIETKRALAIITSEVFSQTEQTSLLMASAAHPDVVKATIEAAKHPTGSKERSMILSHSGFVPVPKTSVVNIHGGKNVFGGAQQNTETVAVLPPIESVVRSISDRFNESHQLAAPAEDAILDGDVEDEESDGDEGSDE